MFKTDCKLILLHVHNRLIDQETISPRITFVVDPLIALIYNMPNVANFWSTKSFLPSPQSFVIYRCIVCLRIRISGDLLGQLGWPNHALSLFIHRQYYFVWRVFSQEINHLWEDVVGLVLNSTWPPRWHRLIWAKLWHMFLFDAILALLLHYIGI